VWQLPEGSLLLFAGADLGFMKTFLRFNTIVVDIGLLIPPKTSFDACFTAWQQDSRGVIPI
jgi:hypothetical protein